MAMMLTFPDQTADVTYCADVTLFSARDIRQAITDCGIFFCADFLNFTALNAIWAHFVGAKLFLTNIIPPKHTEQDQIDVKWLEKSLFSEVRVEEEVEV